MKLFRKFKGTRTRSDSTPKPLKRRRNVAVSPEIHDVIKLYADEKNIYIEDAANELLRMAIKQVYGND